MALNKEQRKAMLASEIDGEPVDVQNVDAVDPAPATKPPAVISPESATPMATISPDMMALVQALAAAIQSGNANIGAQMADAIKANRQPIPENPPDQFPAHSIYHPGGKAEPFENLKTEMFLGIWDQTNGKAVPAYPYESKMLTDEERAALNRLEPKIGELRCTDGTKIPARVVAQQDAMGNLHRIVIALPPTAYDKDHRNTIPGPVEISRQLTAA